MMTEGHMKGAEYEQAARSSDYSSVAQQSYSTPDAAEGVFGSVRPLLGSAGLSGRGNAPLRVATMQKMQQTHGNFATLRAVQRRAANPATPLPVQRQEEGEGEPFIPKFSPLPYPSLELPFGGGAGLAADPSEISLGWKSKNAGLKLGYEYGGNISGEANYKDYWLKGSAGKEGFGLGLGYGNPILTPPGMPPMLNDPSGDLREGSLDPRVIGKSIGEMSEFQSKPGWSFGVQGGMTPELGPYVMGGVGYSF